MLFYRFLLAILAVWAVLIPGGCEAPHPVGPDSFDRLEFSDPTGWVLRIEGNGSGQLDHPYWPGRTVRFPPRTFQLDLAVRRVRQCNGNVALVSPNCSRVTHFSQTENRRRTCFCPEPAWTILYFRRAAEALRRVPGQRPNRRILLKAWQQTPPRAASLR